eukprot:354526-Chlamydomonas_euryale.AAC.10
MAAVRGGCAWRLRMGEKGTWEHITVLPDGVHTCRHAPVCVCVYALGSMQPTCTMGSKQPTLALGSVPPPHALSMRACSQENACMQSMPEHALGSHPVQACSLLPYIATRYMRPWRPRQLLHHAGMAWGKGGNGGGEGQRQAVSVPMTTI